MMGLWFALVGSHNPKLEGALEGRRREELSHQLTDDNNKWALVTIHHPLEVQILWPGRKVVGREIHLSRMYGGQFLLWCDNWAAGFQGCNRTWCLILWHLKGFSKVGLLPAPLVMWINSGEHQLNSGTGLCRTHCHQMEQNLVLWDWMCPIVDSRESILFMWQHAIRY